MNVRFMLWLLVSFVVLTIGVVYVHAVQVRRNADIFLHQAQQAEKNNHFAEAVTYYKRYLSYRPGDPKAQLALAGVMEKKTLRSAGDYAKVVELYEAALRNDPDNPAQDAIRRNLVDRCIAIHRFKDAEEHLKILLRGQKDGKLEQLYARCWSGLGDNTKAVQYYVKAMQDAPQHIPTYVELAAVYEQAGNFQDANKIMTELVKNNDKNYEAHLARARFLRSRKNFDSEETEREINRACELGKDAPEPLLEMIDLALVKPDFDKARKYLNLGIERYSDNPLLYVTLSQLEVNSRRMDEAIACVRRGLKAVSADNQNLLLQQLAVCLIGQGHEEEAKTTIEQLVRNGASQAKIKELDARLQCARGHWREAASILEDLLPHVEPNVETAAEVNLLLGVCYEKRGELDRALRAYGEALRGNPRSAAAHEGKGNILLALGKREDALAEYRAAGDGDPRVAFKVARLLIWKNLRQKSGAQDWTEVDRLVKEAGKSMPDSAELEVLKAHFLAARGEDVQAVSDLAKSTARNPGRLELWLARADFADITRKGAKALDILNEAEAKLGDRVELRLARAYHWQRETKLGPEALAALSRLDEHLEKFNREEEAKLLHGLADVYYRAGKLPEAKRLWYRVADKMPQNIQVRLSLFDLAVRENDAAALERLNQEIRALDSDGTMWRFTQASAILHGIRGAGDKHRTGEARKLFMEVLSRRDAFGPAYRGLAALDEVEGHTQLALEHYEKALNAGDRNPYTLRRYCQLLWNQQRVGEVERILKQSDEQGNLPLDLRKAQASLLLREGEYENAIDLAHQTVDRDSRDPLDMVWLGQIYAAAGDSRRKEAEGYFAKALAMPGAEKLEDPYVAYVQFLVRVGRQDRALQLIQDARAKLSADVRTLALAKCYQAVGEFDKAAAEFDVALKGDSTNLEVLRAVVDFHLRHGQLRKAEPYLVKLLDPKTNAGEGDTLFARRSLALLKATGNYSQYKEAVAMLEENIRQGGGRPEDRRTLAVLLAGYPPTRLRAIGILEALQPQTLEQMRTMARLYEATRDWPKARSLHNRLASDSLSADQPRLAYAAESAMALLRHQEVGDAETWLEKMVKREPASQETVELQVHVLKAQQQPVKALEVVKKYQATKGASHAVAGRLFEELDDQGLAETAYRTWASQGSDPQRVLALAGYLGRRDRKDEALDLCERAAKAGAVDAAAAVGLEMLRPRKNLQERHFRRVERLLDEAGKKNPASTLPLLELAELRDLVQNYADSEKCYRLVLQKNDCNITALNNLAWLLAVRDGNLSEARQLIDRAITLAGELGHLLDTRAIVLLKQGAVKEAQVDLARALQEEETAARYFHLAQTQQKERPKEAINSLRKARELHLSRSQIHPLEFKGYDELLEAMDEK